MRAATNAPRVGSAVAFEKATQNFQFDSVHLTDKSKFEFLRRNRMLKQKSDQKNKDFCEGIASSSQKNQGICCDFDI